VARKAPSQGLLWGTAFSFSCPHLAYITRCNLTAVDGFLLLRLLRCRMGWRRGWDDEDEGGCETRTKGETEAERRKKKQVEEEARDFVRANEWEEWKTTTTTTTKTSAFSCVFNVSPWLSNYHLLSLASVAATIGGGT
jgi:hypothetical protein